MILNGAPAVGKTTVSRLFQSKRYLERGEIWLHVPIDVFDEMIPRDVPMSEIEYHRCAESMYGALAGLARSELNLIVEVVVRHDPVVVEIFRQIWNALASQNRKVLLVSLLSKAEVRESRGKRRISKIPLESFDAALDVSALARGAILSTSHRSPQEVCGMLSDLVDGSPGNAAPLQNGA